jgi:hypothetical protein
MGFQWGTQANSRSGWPSHARSCAMALPYLSVDASDIRWRLKCRRNDREKSRLNRSGRRCPVRRPAPPRLIPNTNRSGGTVLCAVEPVWSRRLCGGELAATGWPTRRSVRQAPQLSPRTVPRYARRPPARRVPWLASRGHGIPLHCREPPAAWLRDGHHGDAPRALCQNDGT